MVRSLMVLALVASAGFAAAQEKKDDKKTEEFPKLIVGKWEITEAGGDAPKGTVVEFDKDMKLVMTLDPAGKKEVAEGTYAIEKDKLTVKLKLGEKTAEETLTITKLTEDAMELEDARGKKDVLKKVK